MDDVEAAKAKQISLRERLAARRQERQKLLEKVGSANQLSPGAIVSSSTSSLLKSTAKFICNVAPGRILTPTKTEKFIADLGTTILPTTAGTLTERRGLQDVLNPSVESRSPVLMPNTASLVRSSSSSTLQEHKELLSFSDRKRSPASSFSSPGQPSPKCSKVGISDTSKDNVGDNQTTNFPTVPHTSKAERQFGDELEDLLAAQTAREKEKKRVREEILELLNTPTAKERYLNERFRSQGGSQVQQFCAQGTRIECSKYKARTGDKEKCTKLHFRKIIHQHTDESLGDCSFLNTCFHVDTCKYVHYTIDYSDATNDQATPASIGTVSSQNKGQAITSNATLDDSSTLSKNHAPTTLLYPPQWINCDIRLLNMSILGKFAVIMADPPWDIHMELPYGTMSDDEMRRLDIPCLQDDGYIFLWVTGRAMELGRDCLRLWGYQRVDEIIWVKTNQLQRLIRTGRTGHWLNHGKEHCLVGVKGNPQGVNRGLDCDVIVSEVRETSHKPDEIYGIIERLSPGTRKLELFGRPHNLQPNWITLGNQLDGTFLVDPGVVERFKKQYPNGLEMSTKS